MHIDRKTKDNSGMVLEVFNPPGHDRFLIQRAGKHPNDGIYFHHLDDLIALLTEFQEKMHNIAPRVFETKHDAAARALLKDSEDFTPSFVTGSDYLAYFVEAVRPCAACNTFMYDGFPKYNKMTLEKQLERAGWRRKSGVTSGIHNNGDLCQACADAGIAKFKCELCGESRPYSEEKERVGDPPDFLCKACFETVTAKEWDDKVNELELSHQWDYR